MLNLPQSLLVLELYHKNFGSDAVYNIYNQTKKLGVINKAIILNSAISGNL